MNKQKVFSSANVAIGGSQQVFNVLLALLYSKGLDPNFEKPFIWIFLLSVSVAIGFYLSRRYKLSLDLNKRTGKNMFDIRNPVLTWSLLLLFPKNQCSIYSLIGTYEFSYVNNHFQIKQVNIPTRMDRVRDIIIFIFVILFWFVLYVLASKVDIVKYGLVMIFGFIYVGIFIQKIVMKWCYVKVSFKIEDGVFVSPLLFHPSRLATISLKNVLLSPKILSYEKEILRYIIEHEKGHLKSYDFIKGLLIDVCVFVLGVWYLYLDVTNNNISFVALGLMLCVFL